MKSTRRRNLEFDPWRAVAHLARRPGTVVLQRPASCALGWRWGRTAVLFSPRWTAVDDQDGWHWSGDVPASRPPAAGPLALPGWSTRLGHVPEAPALPRLAGFVGYDTAPGLPDLVHPVPAPGSPPNAWFGAYDRVLWIDPEGGASIEAHDLGPMAGTPSDPEAVLEATADALATLDLEDPPTDPPAPFEVRPFDRDWHRRAVDTVRSHLRAGDSYQINLTGFVELRGSRSPWEVFRRECGVNPAGFAAFVHTGEHVVTSHSPELLLRVEGERATTAPIKGTAPSALAAGLSVSEKDRAEHVMIVDLCRNDLGRRALPGSVHVRPLLQALPLRGLVHLVSEVHATVPRSAQGGLLADLFPGGSITGAPKRRSREIIRSIERSGRGPYTGTVGAVDTHGDMDWNIAIRTALWHNAAAWFGCGGGIVLDSDADREYDEAMLKASSFLDSVRHAPTAAPIAGAVPPGES